MKKFIIIFATIVVLTMLFCPSTAKAEGIEEEEKKEEILTEETGTDYDKLADKVYERIKDELPQGLSNNIEELLDSWKATEKEDATFTDRVKEFFDPDNIVNTVSMLFMVVAGVLLFYLKKKQGISIMNTDYDLIALKESSDKNNQILAEEIEKLIKTIEQKADSSEKSRLASVGVANMLKDIFMNSRTIDEAGKKIMNLDYLKAIGEPIEDVEEKKDEV